MAALSPSGAGGGDETFDGHGDCGSEGAFSSLLTGDPEVEDTAATGVVDETDPSPEGEIEAPGPGEPNGSRVGAPSPSSGTGAGGCDRSGVSGKAGKKSKKKHK